MGSIIVTRETNGVPLTFQQMDNNFSNLYLLQFLAYFYNLEDAKNILDGIYNVPTLNENGDSIDIIFLEGYNVIRLSDYPYLFTLDYHFKISNPILYDSTDVTTFRSFGDYNGLSYPLGLEINDSIVYVVYAMEDFTSSVSRINAGA